MFGTESEHPGGEDPRALDRPAQRAVSSSSRPSRVKPIR